MSVRRALRYSGRGPWRHPLDGPGGRLGVGFVAGLLRIAAVGVLGAFEEGDPTGNEQIKRGYNQAFFKKLYVMPEWDQGHEQMVVRIIKAELTEPYAVLLAEDLDD